jgi:riboflavin synthase
MFTGIIEEIGKVMAAQPGKLVIAASITRQGMEPGASIAVNGVCLTMTDLSPGSFSVDLMPETLKRTNLGQLSAGGMVNLERPLALNGRMGGHMVQGHVDDTGRVASIRDNNGAMLIRFDAPPDVMRYIVAKGFIAVDGISLTVVDKDTGSFQISAVDYTLKHTTLGTRRVGDMVNLEVDIIAKYVEQFYLARKPGITADFLQEHGFISKMF